MATAGGHWRILQALIKYTREQKHMEEKFWQVVVRYNQFGTSRGDPAGIRYTDYDLAVETANKYAAQQNKEFVILEAVAIVRPVPQTETIILD